jgi:transcriptional/translational regulatory protein YebC/TACO1
MGGFAAGSGRLPSAKEVETEVRALLTKTHGGLGITVSVEWAPPAEGGYYVRLHLGDDSELVGERALSGELEEWATEGTAFLRVLVESAAAELVRRAREKSEEDEP